MNKYVLTAAVISVLGLGIGASVNAADDKKDLSAAYKDKAAIEQIVKDYLLNNPKIVVDSLAAYETQQAEEAAKAAKEALKESADELFNDPDSPVAGNEKGNVTVVEFFDYNCGYCKRALGDVVELIDEDKNLKVVLKEVPILSPGSREAAKWALAAKKQGKYFEYHVELMENRGQLDEDRLEKLAKKVGLDIDKLKKDKESEAVSKAIDNNLALMQKLGIRGTPSFVVGDTLARGYVGKDRLKDYIAGERNKK